MNGPDDLPPIPQPPPVGTRVKILPCPEYESELVGKVGVVSEHFETQEEHRFDALGMLVAPRLGNEYGRMAWVTFDDGARCPFYPGRMEVLP